MTPSDAEFIERFEQGQWPLDRWHHADHIRLAYLYLLIEPNFDSAMDRLRSGINHHNNAHGIIDAPTMAYRETMTRAWLTLTKAMLHEYGPCESAEAFVSRSGPSWPTRRRSACTTPRTCSWPPEPSRNGSSRT
jgi:hypothetical protein